MGNKYYSVRKGKKPGIYNTWKECQDQIMGYSGAEYKKFSKREEALAFIDNNDTNFKKEIEDLKDKELIAYVDGSYDIKGHTYSYGVVLLSQDKKETFSGREDDTALAQMRNVSGEIKGAMVAMEKAIQREVEVLYLHFDYTGIEQWALGNWKTNKEGTRAYKEFYDSIKDRLKVVFIKVKAHAGIEYNEEADKLAKEAIR